MDTKEIKDTDIWTMYQKCIDFGRLRNIYSETDKNYRFYNGDQWEGIKLSGIEPVQLNYIKPIVNFKVGTINANLWAINYSNENYENEQFRETGNRLCKMLNTKAARFWEKNNMDFKIRIFSTDAAVNDEGVLYAYWNEKEKMPNVEVLSKTDVYYGNENKDEIQTQPYIIIKRRMSVVEACNIAKQYGADIEQIKFGDYEYNEEAGEDSQYELDPNVTVLTKLYRTEGKVHYSIATRHCDICKDQNTGLENYPVVHMIWSKKYGSARGEGVVRSLIPNQIEVNKTLMRRALVAKNTAYPQKVIDVTKIINPSAVEKVGATIKVNGQSVEDVRKVFNVTTPAQMSTDVEKLMNDLIQVTRDLEGASDMATGSINPSDASGKAILAVQRASEMPLTEQATYLKSAIEDLARIFFDMIVANSDDEITLEEEQTNKETGETYYVAIKIPTYMLEELRLGVKIDVTPNSAYDRFAQEETIEHLLMNGFFTPQRLEELKIYAKVLPNQSVAPKQQILEAIKLEEENRRKIAEIEARTQLKMQRVKEFMESDPDAQAQQMAEAEMQAQDNTVPIQQNNEEIME